MLSRKYYRMIAKAIKISDSKQQLIDRLCDEFKNDNPYFDCDVFLDACLDTLPTSER